jgi:hypothetical protein
MEGRKVIKVCRPNFILFYFWWVAKISSLLGYDFELFFWSKRYFDLQCINTYKKKNKSYLRFRLFQCKMF